MNARRLPDICKNTQHMQGSLLAFFHLCLVSVIFSGPSHFCNACSIENSPVSNVELYTHIANDNFITVLIFCICCLVFLCVTNMLCTSLTKGIPRLVQCCRRLMFQSDIQCCQLLVSFYVYAYSNDIHDVATDVLLTQNFLWYYFFLSSLRPWA